MQPIIKVRNLSKRYLIGSRAPYRTVRESLTNVFASPLRALTSRFSGKGTDGAGRVGSDIWALNDVGFDVMPGEVLGIVGRNGAGKSTLLKVLARITEPTTGRVELFGRVGSLLEIGTGFHPELTGRENISLSGAILGMRRAEINRKFDEMVAFAGVEQFIDTPVKHYSSGMYTRLAFAVAAHLEPEILMVDEVLAVGDAAFQRKCLGKMGEVARQGRTVLFVSHNLAAVESLCDSCLLLKAGRLEASGRPADIVNRYMASELADDSGIRWLAAHPGRQAGATVLMERIELFSGAGSKGGVVRMGSPLVIKVSYRGERPTRPVLGLRVRSSQGMPIFSLSDRFAEQLADCEPSSCGTVVCSVEKLPLMPGRYVIDLWLGEGGDITRDLDIIFDAASFEVSAADLYGTGRLPPASGGPVFCSAVWTLENTVRDQ